MTEDFLNQLAEYERMTVLIDEDEMEYDEENDVMEIIDHHIDEEVNPAADDRVAELLKEIEGYKKVISDAQDAMTSAEQELDTLLARN